MAIIVHHLMYSRSLRVLWLLEELGLEYELVRYERDADFRAPPSLERVHPLGRAPVVEVDGVVLAESGAILEYFADREGRLRPTSPEGLREYRFFLHYAEGSAMPPLLVQLLVERVRTAPMPMLVKPIARRIAQEIERNYSGPAISRHFGFVENTLSQRQHFAGAEFSAADIQMFYPVEAALRRRGAEWPHLRRWRERVTERDAYRRAEQKGGPALPEPRASRNQ
jgi:glutathione S-transferase